MLTLNHFAEIYGDLCFPVLVCESDADLGVVYMNMQATMLFSPGSSAAQLSGGGGLCSLADTLQGSAPSEMEAMHRLLATTGRLEVFPLHTTTFDGTPLEVVVCGNTLRLLGREYFALFLLEKGEDWALSPQAENRFASVINAAILNEDVNDSIQSVLSAAGRQMRVSRAYIFESVSAATTRNSYEWCAAGVTPEIQNLQNLDKADYPYDVIVSAGMFIANDISALPEESREVLEPQHIKALAIITIYDSEGPVGYVGFDDTERVREWSHAEIQFLKNISLFLSTLLKRRNSEQKARRSAEVLQLVTDNAEDVIYANTLDDYRLVFVSQALQRALGKTADELIGRRCYEVFRRGQDAPCTYCPIFKLAVPQGDERSAVYEWENELELTGRTYMARDSIIRWVDGRMVHLEVAFDITQRKEYETKLHYYATTDTMTGVMNREWGGVELEKLLQDDARRGSLCFVDVDGLKKVNDQLGHAYGDEMLAETVRQLKGALRDEDFICRWGGDEFLLYFQAEPDEAARRIQAVQRALAAENETGERSYRLSFSYGIVAFSGEGGQGLDALVTAADLEMYKNKMEKRSGRSDRRRNDKL